MKIEKTIEGGKLRFLPQGRLDTLTAPDAEKEIASCVDEASEFIFDCSKLEYISSAGLRILLSTQKKMTAKGGVFTVTGANEIVKEIFEITGFSDVLNIK